jgi:hypothetical protein
VPTHLEHDWRATVSMPLDWSDLNASPERWMRSQQPSVSSVFGAARGPNIGSLLKKSRTYRSPPSKDSEVRQLRNGNRRLTIYGFPLLPRSVQRERKSFSAIVLRS